MEFKDQFQNKNKTLRFKKAVEEIEEAIRSATPKVCLKHMSIDAILCTLEENISTLETLYKSRANILDRLNQGNGLDYLTILHRTLTSEQQQQMYLQIVDKFAEDKKTYKGNRIVSVKILKMVNIETTYFLLNLLLQHENLFWAILLPEWAVGICMKNFRLSRKETLERIKREDDESLNASAFNLSF